MQNISLIFNEGLTGIIGINGIGKSTLLKTIAGLIEPLSGDIFLGGTSIIKIDSELRAKTISVVLTERINDPFMKVFDIVLSGRSPYTGFIGKPNENDILITENYIAKCGIKHLHDKKITEISDGEKQKCMIARALAQETPVILLDEPTSFLDFRARYEIMELLSNISSEENKIIIFSSHDLEIIFKSTQKCLVILNESDFILENTDDLANSNIPERLLEGTNLFFDKKTRSINLKGKK